MTLLAERQALDAERRIRSDVLQPLERWMHSARNRTWRRAAQDVAVDPGGGILTAPDRSAGFDETDGGDLADDGGEVTSPVRPGSGAAGPGKT